jgi:hypothetical protein
LKIKVVITIGLVLLSGMAVSGCDFFSNNQNQRNPLRQFFAPKTTPAPIVTATISPTPTPTPILTLTPVLTPTPLLAPTVIPTLIPTKPK